MTERSVHKINIISLQGYKDGSPNANQLNKCDTEIYSSKVLHNYPNMCRKILSKF